MYQSSEVSSPPSHQMRIEPLTERETQVMEQLRKGLTVREIAAAMGVSINTTKHHMRNIYSKLDVRSRSEALKFPQLETGSMAAGS